MKKDKMYSSAEYQTNPLYRKIRERFSFSGNSTIGDFMRSRAKRDGYPVAGDTATLAAPVMADKTPSVPQKSEITTVKSVQPSKAVLFFKKHVTFFACVALFLCISLTLAIIIPVCSNLTASAGEDGMGGSEVAEELPEEPVMEEGISATHDATFENILYAFDN